MKLATIFPASPPEVFDVVASMSSYQFVLGQYLLTDGAYREWVRQLAERGDFIIVDNGAAEGITPPLDSLITTALSLGADEIVVPDVLRSIDETIKRYQRWAHMIPPRKRMIVPQGETWQEWQDCLRFLSSVGPFRSIGVPKHLERLEGGRPRAIEYLVERGFATTYDIHLLGCWGNPIEEVKAVLDVYPYIRGIDTGAPVAFAQADVRITDYRVHIPLSWTGYVDPGLVAQNILLLMEACKHAHNNRRSD